MKHTRQKVTGKAGVIYVQKVVNDHGSIFHPVHEENDLGVDGFIELVKAQESSCRLVAVQIKSGDSYFSASTGEFEIDVDARHLDYWLEFPVPVILVCYSPAKDLAAWVSVRDHAESERYHDRPSVTQIRIPRHEEFDTEALSKGIASLAHVRADERLLIKCADMCLSRDLQARRWGFQILSHHPDSRRLNITSLLARRLIMDRNVETAKDALFSLGFGVGRRRWSWNPNNRDEVAQSTFAAELCGGLSEEEMGRLLELCDDEAFSGPEGLGERLFDVLCCCFDTAEGVLYAVACDASKPMRRRANALYLLHQCDDDVLNEARRDLRANARLRDVIDWILEPAPDDGG